MKASDCCRQRPQRGQPAPVRWPSRLKFIRHARDLGFEVAAIRQLLDLAEQPQRSCAKVDALAREHLRAISSRIERLAALKFEIEHMIKSCAKGRIAKCRVIDVLSHHEHCLHEMHYSRQQDAIDE
jgi:uncharacterized protein (UPF0335 family)